MASLSHPKYRADIDGLRAIAVLSVVGFHAFPSGVRGGFIGVDIFFVISGFLISTIIFGSLGNNKFSFSEFYSRRVKRIFPSLILVLSVCYSFGWFALLTDEYQQLGKHIAAGAGFISNIVLWNESGYFDNAAEIKPLLHLWSLGIEEQFYIFWPLFLWVAWKKKFNLLASTILIVLISFGLNLLNINTNSVADFYSPYTRFWELLVGSLLAWFTLYKQNEFINFKSRFGNIQSIVGACLIIISLFVISKSRNFPGVWALLPTIGAAMIISGGPQSFINRGLSNKVLVWFGLISYPLYLWHWPLLSFARIVESEMPSHRIRIAAIAVSIILAWLTYEFIEKPFRFGQSGKAKTIALVVCMTIIGSLGYSTYLKEGFEFRKVANEYKNNKNELTRTPETDKDCLEYIGQDKPEFTYCRFTNMKSSETVAVIGDSHAHVSYPGIASILEGEKINTLLLANSGCPPFIGSEYGNNNDEKLKCKKRIEDLLKIVLEKKDIHKIFIFSRGPLYLTGKYFGEAEVGVNKGPLIKADVYKASLQKTIDVLNTGGKKVYYITENPELRLLPNACSPRPFRISAKVCDVDLETIKNRQEEYLDISEHLRNVTVINSLKAFCPDKKCFAVQNGELLYADFDHLSVAGSHFQANQLLKSFLIQQ